MRFTVSRRTYLRASQRISWLVPLAAPLLLTGCPPIEPNPDAGADAGNDAGEPVVFGKSKGLDACDEETVKAHPEARCHTFRALAGVSMGGGTSSRIGFSHPELFDVVGIMGTPFADSEFLWNMLQNGHLGGFCSLEQLERVLADDPNRLNDPNDPEVFCGHHDVFPLEGNQQIAKRFPAVEGSQCYLFESDYNHWYRGPDAGRGGGFARNSLIDIMHDLVAAYGNPLVYNEASNYFPPGIPTTWYVPPHSDDENQRYQQLCANPLSFTGVYNREYNPEGTYPVVTYCDGNNNDSGDYDPTVGGRIPIEFLVAVDLNQNGVRDYGEPVIVNNRERFGDFGTDNIPDVQEAGYDAVNNPDPAGDNWDPLTNPTGTELNTRLDDGEQFDDDGLDGVPATGDFGESNGVYDLSPTLERIFERSPARYFETMSDEQRRRLDIWMDAGIRDFLNTAQISNSLFAELKKHNSDAKVFNDFGDLPGIVDKSSYVYFDADYSREAMGQVAYLRYGDAAVCPSTDDILGDGNHVGQDIIHRLYTLMSFLSARLPAQGRDKPIGGSLEDLESPTGALTDFGYMDSYESEVLGRTVEFGVTLPPDYFARPDNEYPVMYFFHGQGQDARGMMGTGLILWGGMKEASREDRVDTGPTDFQRQIMIWVDGDCVGDSCYTGNFYADFEGLPRDDRRYEEAFFELMRHVDEKYRTKKPELIQE